MNRMMQCCSVALTISLLLILSVNPSSTAITKNKVYGLKGGSIELVNPQPVGTVTSIIWKHGRDKAAEWFEEDGESTPTYYLNYINVTYLDMNTWSLTISDLQPKFMGEYSAEVNNKDATQSWDLIIREAVRKPTIDIDFKNICNATSCTLTCRGEGDYTWYDADGQQISTDQEITVQRKDQDMDYTCKLSNEVSSETSIVKVPRLVDSSPNIAGLAVGITLPLIIIIIIIASILLILYRRKSTPGKDEKKGNENQDGADVPLTTVETNKDNDQDGADVPLTTVGKEGGELTQQEKRSIWSCMPCMNDEGKGKKDQDGRDVQLTGFETKKDNDQDDANVPLITVGTDEEKGKKDQDGRDVQLTAIGTDEEKGKKDQDGRDVQLTAIGPDEEKGKKDQDGADVQLTAIDSAADGPTADSNDGAVNKTPGAPASAAEGSTADSNDGAVNKTPDAPETKKDNDQDDTKVTLNTVETKEDNDQDDAKVTLNTVDSAAEGSTADSNDGAVNKTPDAPETKKDNDQDDTKVTLNTVDSAAEGSTADSNDGAVNKTPGAPDSAADGSTADSNDGAVNKTPGAPAGPSEVGSPAPKGS